MKPLYIYFLAASLACTSCSDSWLDLNPSTSVPTDQAFTTLENAQTALNGIYRLASAHSYYGDNFFYFGDCRAADVQARMSKGDGKRVSPYYEYNVKSTDSFNTSLPWNQVYKVIRQINNLIAAIEGGQVNTTDTQALDEIKAQALAMRGLALYDLIRVFAMPYSYDNGQSLGSAEAGSDSQSYLGLSEDCIVGTDSDITAHGNLTSAAQSKAVDSCDHGNGEGFDFAEHIVTLLAECLALCLGQAAHLSDICTCHEGLTACTGDHQTTNRCQIYCIQCSVQFIQYLRIQSVQCLFTVDGDGCHIAILLIQNVIHVFTSFHISISIFKTTLRR